MNQRALEEAQEVKRSPYASAHDYRLADAIIELAKGEPDCGEPDCKHCPRHEGKPLALATVETEPPAQTEDEAQSTECACGTVGCAYRQQHLETAREVNARAMNLAPEPRDVPEPTESEPSIDEQCENCEFLRSQVRTLQREIDKLRGPRRVNVRPHDTRK